MLARGLMQNNLYPLHSSQKRLLQSTHKVAFSSILASPTLWHQRLGHPAARVVQKLHSHKAIKLTNKDFPKVCSTCQLGKSKCKSFSVSDSISCKPLALVHFDIWGPAPISFTLVYRNYILFIDDFSKFTWIYPINSRTDSLQCFKLFKLSMENLLDSKIKEFQNDGAYELIKCVFK